MKSRLLIILCCILSAAGCDQSTSGTTSGDPDTKPKLVLQLNWKAEPQFGGFYAALVHGEYTKHHLEIDVKEGGAGVPTIDMLAAGTVKFAVVSGDEIILARARGKKIVGLFAVYQTHPQGIMTRTNRGFKDIGDVFKAEGTLAMEQGLPYSDFLKDKYGFEKVKIVPSPFGDLSLFRADENYSMQCFVTSEPLAAKKLGLDVQTFLIADSGYNPYATVLATTDEYVKENRPAVRAMLTAVRAGWDRYLTDPAATNAAMGKINQTMDAQTFIDSADAQQVLIATTDTATAGVGSMTKKRWQTLAEQMVALKVIESAPPAAECFVDPATLSGN